MLESIINLIGDIICQIVSKPPKVENKDDEIIFKFNNKLKYVMLFCIIEFSLFLIVLLVLFIIEPDSVFFVVFLGFGLFWGLSLYGYLIQKNKKVLLKNNIFFVTNFIGRVKEFRFEDIIKAKFIYGDGVVLYTWSNQKFKIDEQMSNYELLVGKLLEKDIQIINWRGNAVGRK